MAHLLSNEEKLNFARMLAEEFLPGKGSRKKQPASRSKARAVPPPPRQNPTPAFQPRHNGNTRQPPRPTPAVKLPVATSRASTPYAYDTNALKFLSPQSGGAVSSSATAAPAAPSKADQAEKVKQSVSTVRAPRPHAHNADSLNLLSHQSSEAGSASVAATHATHSKVGQSVKDKDPVANARDPRHFAYVAKTLNSILPQSKNAGSASVVATPAATSKVDQSTKAKEPVVVVPKVEQPATSAPKVQQPVATAPKAQQPVHPKIEQNPKTSAPRAYQANIAAPIHTTQIPTKPSTDIFQELIQAVPDLKSALLANIQSIECPNLSDDSDDEDTDSDSGGDSTSVSLLEFAARFFPELYELTEAQRSNCACGEARRAVFGLDNSKHNANRVENDPKDIRQTMLAKSAVSALRQGRERGHIYARKALAVQLVLIDHCQDCPYVEVIKKGHPTYFGVPLAIAGGSSEEDDLEVVPSLLRQPENAAVPTHEFYERHGTGQNPRSTQQSKRPSFVNNVQAEAQIQQPRRFVTASSLRAQTGNENVSAHITEPQGSFSTCAGPVTGGGLSASRWA